MPSRPKKPLADGSACRRFRFAFADAKRGDGMAKRRAAIAQYFDEWGLATIVAERSCGSECVVTVELRKAVPSAVAERFCRECPHYIRDTFATADGIKMPSAL